MKPKFILTLIAAFFAIVGMATMTHCKNAKPEIIEITKYSTQFYLDSLTAALNKKGVKFKIDTVGFNNKGDLQIISGQIIFSSIYKGTFSTDNLEKIVISKTDGRLTIKVN